MSNQPHKNPTNYSKLLLGIVSFTILTYSGFYLFQDRDEEKTEELVETISFIPNTTTAYVEPSKELSTFHYGLYDYYDFLEIYKYDDGEYIETYTQTVGLESGDYLYKNTWWDSPEYVYDELVIEWCLDDGFTQEECDSSASYEWENPNVFEGIYFKQNSMRCVDVLNQKIDEININFFTIAENYGYPSPRWSGNQELKYFVPKLSIEGPEKLSTNYLTILEFRYDDGGGTLRYPFINSYTMNLVTCEFENIEDNYVITKKRIEELVLEYVQFGNDMNPNGYVVEDYLFSEDYLTSDIFFTKDTLYTILWDCRICTDSYLILKDAKKNRANPYIVAIPLYEFKVKGTY